MLRRSGGFTSGPGSMFGDGVATAVTSAVGSGTTTSSSNKGGRSTNGAGFGAGVVT